jgi:undecaprenyl-diphosphatase
MFGLNRLAATEFSFLIAIPTMLAAGGFKILQALHHSSPGIASENWAMVLLGFIVSAVVSFVVVKWMLSYIQKHTFIAFGWYRIVLATGLFLILLT